MPITKMLAPTAIPMITPILELSGFGVGFGPGGAGGGATGNG